MGAFFFGKEENMTVQKQFIKNIYIGNGSNKVFPFTFECPAEHPEFIHVYVKSNNVLTETGNYILNMDARNITYPAAGEALEVGSSLVIARELPLNQVLNLVNQGPFFAEDIEVTFDEVVMMIQQLNEKLGRAAAFGIDVESFDPTLPIQAGYGFRVSDDGTHFEPIENSEIVLNQTKQVYEQAVKETEQIKAAAVAETTAIKNDTKDIYNTAVNSTLIIKNETQAIRDEAFRDTKLFKEQAEAAADTALGAEELARKWAEASTNPNPLDINSKSSKSWAELAKNDALEAARQAQYCTAMASQGVVFDINRTYSPADVVMMPNGETYRCIAESTGELPPNSSKWVAVSTVVSDTFEEDENGDLMPLLYPKASSQFEIDDSGDIMPAL